LTAFDLENRGEEHPVQVGKKKKDRIGEGGTEFLKNRKRDLKTDKN